MKMLILLLHQSSFAWRQTLVIAFHQFQILIMCSKRPFGFARIYCELLSLSFDMFIFDIFDIFIFWYVYLWLLYLGIYSSLISWSLISLSFDIFIFWYMSRIANNYSRTKQQSKRLIKVRRWFWWSKAKNWIPNVWIKFGIVQGHSKLSSYCVQLMLRFRALSSLHEKSMKKKMISTNQKQSFITWDMCRAFPHFHFLCFRPMKEQRIDGEESSERLCEPVHIKNRICW